MSFRFIIEAIKNPREVGAIIPASKHLAKAITAEAESRNPTSVIEIGCGNGIITTYLQKASVIKKAIELNPEFVQQAKKRSPETWIMQGDASTVEFNIDRESNVIVCSIPFLSIPSSIALNILNNLIKNMPEEFTFINYSYKNNLDLGEIDNRYQKIKSKKVLINLPPAYVHTYTVNSRN